MPEPYELKLQAIRRRRAAAKILWIAFVPLVLFGGIVPLLIWQSAPPIIAIFFLYVVVFLYTGFRVHRFPCPRCGAGINTARRSFWLPKVRTCATCGLNID